MIYSKLQTVWESIEYPFLQNSDGKELYFRQLSNIKIDSIDRIREGDVVALIGDFDPETIATLLILLEKGAIVVPLTIETRSQHSYFLQEAHCQHIFEKNKFKASLSTSQKSHRLLDSLRELGHPGLILFTTGTTGRPKAILHDFIPFIARYGTPRPPLKAISFLLFDHIGGLNTLFHMLFNQGQVVSLKERTVEAVVNSLTRYSIQLLPTTPTFLRMMSLHPGIEKRIPISLKIISYGTERMDQPTLSRLCKQFPNIDFRQTYGMSELGILRIKTKARDSLYMKVGGENIETKVVEDILHIRAKNKMLGYLNANSPFDSNGWYCTKDIVDQIDGGYLKIIGRDSEIINIGGLKFMPSEIERECLKDSNVRHAKAVGKFNPITGQHVELFLEVDRLVDPNELKRSIMVKLKESLPKYMVPSRVHIERLKISHRFKKL